MALAEKGLHPWIYDDEICVFFLRRSPSQWHNLYRLGSFGISIDKVIPM
jgi:hypothetical protein